MKMKDSGIDWIGMVPEGWEVRQLKRIVRLKGGTGFPIERQGIFTEAIRFIKVNALASHINPMHEYDTISYEDAFAMQATIFPQGSIVFAKVGAALLLHRFEKLPFDCCIDNNLMCLYDISADSKWLQFSLSLLNFNSLVNPGAVPSVNQSQVGMMPIAVPPLSEQQAIANYLDEKCGKIDEQVKLLEKKVDAYKNLKRSVINETVTRGLDKNVKLKDSGVDWIGMVPEGWEVTRFKNVFDYTTGITPDSKNESYFGLDDADYTWITIADMDKKVVERSALNLTEKAIRTFVPRITKKGSLIFSFKLSIGKVSFAGKDLITNEAIASIPPSNNYILDYWYYFLPMILDKNARENIYGAKMLNQGIIFNMLMPVPPLSEQQAIATYLDKKCNKIDKSIELVEKQIDAYKRLKRSLINEVVTGKRRVE